MWVGNENSCINIEQGSLYPKSETESMFQGYNKTKIKERKGKTNFKRMFEATPIKLK